MNVVYSVWSRIGAGGLGVDSLEAVKALYEKGYLKKAVCYGNRQNVVPARFFRSINLHPVKIFSNLPARYYYPIKRKALDRVTVKELRKGADIFHGWSGSCYKTLEYCRSHGIISILENPGPHLNYTDALVEQKYDDLGVQQKNVPEFFPKFFGQDRDYLTSELELASYILLESQFTIDTFIDNGFPAEKLLYVPRGVDTVRFHPPGKRDRRPFRVLFIGAVCVRKGVSDLLEAWKGIDIPDAELVLVGQVRSDVQKLISDAQRNDPTIKVLGHVNDPVRLFQESSIFVFPSLSEGSAKVTYEAMSCGLPVIVTPNAGSVARDGIEGYVVPISSPQLIREKIRYLHENPDVCEMMGRNARQYMTESFTWEKHRELLIATYEKLLERHS